MTIVCDSPQARASWGHEGQSDSASPMYTQPFSPVTASSELEAMMVEVIDSAQRAFPDILLAPEIFVAYLFERIPVDSPPLVALRHMHTVDLYLACACGRGDINAFAAFEARCMRRLDRVLLKMDIGADASADVKQEIRARLLAGDGGRARIRDFSGRGDLRGWVRVIAVRLALQHQLWARRETPLEEDERLLQLAAPDNHGSDHRTRIYRQEFKRAFEAALRLLPDRMRTLLRQHYVDALSIDEIGVLYRVHRSTAARLLARSRLLLLEATRARMMSRLGVQPPDLDSIMRMIRSQLEISLRVLLRSRKC